MLASVAYGSAVEMPGVTPLQKSQKSALAEVGIMVTTVQAKLYDSKLYEFINQNWEKMESEFIAIGKKDLLQEVIRELKRRTQARDQSEWELKNSDDVKTRQEAKAGEKDAKLQGRKRPRAQKDDMILFQEFAECLQAQSTWLKPKRQLREDKVTTAEKKQVKQEPELLADRDAESFLNFPAAEMHRKLEEKNSNLKRENFQLGHEVNKLKCEVVLLKNQVMQKDKELDDKQALLNHLDQTLVMDNSKLTKENKYLKSQITDLHARYCIPAPGDEQGLLQQMDGGCRSRCSQQDDKCLQNDASTDILGWSLDCIASACYGASSPSVDSPNIASTDAPGTDIGSPSATIPTSYASSGVSLPSAFGQQRFQFQYTAGTYGTMMSTPNPNLAIVYAVETQ